MRWIIAPLVSTLCLLPALALDPPTSITNARVEVRAGTSPSAAIDRTVRDRGTSWVGWSVRAVPEAGDMCCFTSSFKRRGCSLGERERSWGSSDRLPGDPTPEMYVLVQVNGGEPDRVMFLSALCPVDGADRRLVAVRQRTDEQEIAEVQTGDQQHGPDGREQK